METGIERLTALAFIIIGLSHISAPRTWVRFFAGLARQGEVAGFLNAWVHIPLGLLILAFHWTWEWPKALVTFIGCGLTFKGTLYFLRPGLALKSIGRLSEDRLWECRLAGVIAVAIGLAAGWMSLNWAR